MDSQVFETSAKNGANVDHAVLALMREVLHHRKYAKEEDLAETGKESDRCTGLNVASLSCLASSSL